VPDPSGPGLAPILEAEQLRERGLEDCVGASPVVIEIGFGRAELIMELAAAYPERRFLGVEVSRKRVEKSGRRVAKRQLRNVRLVHAPAEYLLERVLPDASIAECWINCPDPWPKRRHHKRRLVRAEFVLRLARVLELGALLHISTDHRGYAEWIHGVMSELPGFRNLHAPEPWSDSRPARPETAYEAEWIAEGRSIAYFDYVREGGSEG
jgi:tRNA (guanine-N7-)-methyltransferase